MTANPSSPVPLTKAYILQAFSSLAETKDILKRNEFFTSYVSPTVIWEVAGHDHSMAGIRYNLADHTAATWTRMAAKIKEPIKFEVRSVILDGEERRASVELRGKAVKLNGEAYDNDYVWLTTWDDEGRIVAVRSYHDTALAERVVNEEF